MGGGATAAVLTLGTAVDESRTETAKVVVTFPNRFSSRDGNLWSTILSLLLSLFLLVFCLVSLFV